MFETASSAPILTQRGFRLRSLLTSVGIHAAAVLGLFTLHFYRPIQAVAERPIRVTLLSSPVIRPLPPGHALPQPVPKPIPTRLPILRDADPVSAPPTTRSTARVFEAPKPDPVPVASLTLPREPSVELEPVRLASAGAEFPRFATAPPPPLKTDNLAAAFSAPAVVTQGVTQSAIRSTSFGANAATGDPRDAAASAPRSLAAGTSFSLAVVSPAKPATNNGNAKPGAFPAVEMGGTKTDVKVLAPSADSKSLQILSRPRPEYTAEARRLQIEGEALLEVMFSAAGQARVLRVIRGLGYGLDENAIAAAQSIRFRPAERSGAPVDFTAIVHIVFQLAY